MEPVRDMRETVMARIKEGAVSMRPRWQFVLLSLLWAGCAALLVLAILYFSSLAIFVLRENGVWLAPLLGMRGWFDVLRSAPLLIILLVAFCAIVLNLLVRRFAFAYRRPVVLSLGIVLLGTFIGGVLVGVSPFHRELHRHAREGRLPPPFGAPYARGPLRPPPPDDVYRGTVIERMGSTLFIKTAAGTTTVHISPRTRLPLGADFETGDPVVIFGDAASGAVEAFGILEMEDELLED